MANNITNYPYVIDTAGAGTIIGTPLRIIKIRWTGATTAGHQAILQDQNGNLFWESVADAANYVEESDFAKYNSQRNVINGFKVPTLGSGKLEIYF